MIEVTVSGLTLDQQDSLDVTLCRKHSIAMRHHDYDHRQFKFVIARITPAFVEHVRSVAPKAKIVIG